MTLETLLHELSHIATERAVSLAKQTVCVCNADSWNEIGIQLSTEGAHFLVCPACDPKKECTLCNQTGHKSFLETHKEIYRDGKEFEVTMQNIQPNACVCMNVHKISSLLNNAEIPDRYIKAHFNNFQFSHLTHAQSKILEQNIIKMRAFSDSVGTKYFATLFGPVGSGKTFLAIATLKEMIMKHKLKGKFIDFQYLLSLIRNQFDQNQTGEKLIHMYRTTDVLVIDEFAKGRIDKEWPLEKLDDLINYRYNHKKITILTTNYLPFQLKYEQKQKPTAYSGSAYISETPIHESFWDKTLSERIGERMYDRLMEVSEFINFTTLPSYRRLMAKDFLMKMSI